MVAAGNCCSISEDKLGPDNTTIESLGKACCHIFEGVCVVLGSKPLVAVTIIVVGAIAICFNLLIVGCTPSIETAETITEDSRTTSAKVTPLLRLQKCT